MRAPKTILDCSGCCRHPSRRRRFRSPGIPRRQLDRPRRCRESPLFSLLLGLPRLSWRRQRRKRPLPVNIAPRNFVAATFKCRSTPTGTLPTDEDIYNAIKRGLVNSNMPGWYELDEPAARRSGCVHQELFAAMEKRKLQATPIQCRPKPTQPRQPEARQATFHQTGMLQVSWRAGPGRRAGGSFADGQQQPADPSLRFSIGCALQVRDAPTRPVQDLHDRSRRHAHAFVRRRDQAGRGLGPGALPAHACRSHTKARSFGSGKARKEGAEIVKAAKTPGTPTGSGVN